MDNKRRVESVEERLFDVAVIGGGIIGAGVARDAALRGMSVCLLEQRDFGSGTTSGSTRLIHGGLRYLEMLDFGLVRMDLRERETLLRIAPHLVRPLEFLIPFYSRSLFERVKLHAGMVLYDALSYDKSLPGYRTLDAAEVMEAEPGLRGDGLQGAVSYFDAQVDSPERLAVENIVDANRHGAITLNYVEVTGALHDEDGRVVGVKVQDRITGEAAEVRARVVVNASGPWFDRVARRIEDAPAPKIRTTKGIHIAFPPLTERAVVLFSGVDDRLMFVIPLLGFGWVGTTDTDFTADPSEASATEEDVEYLIRSAGEYVPAINNAPVLWTNAGVRALVMQEGRESEVSRSHRVETGPGLVSILGGKITGYRYIAQDAVDAVAEQLGNKTECSTAEQCLPGATAEAPADLRSRVKHSVETEHCLHVDDFMLRRSTFGLTADRGLNIVDEVADVIAGSLGWADDERASQIARYKQFVEKTSRTPSSRT